jgi:hypothetical protein
LSVVGRSEKPISGDGPLAEFARRLRAVRAEAGMPTYRAMQSRGNYSHAVLAKAASGEALPSWQVTKAYLQALGARGEVDRFELARWETYHGEVERTLANLARKVGKSTTVTPGGEISGASTCGRPVVVEHATAEQALPHPETVRTYEDLTRELNILRIAAGQPSFRELSATTHWAASTICEVFGGRRRPTSDMVRDLAHALYTRLHRGPAPACLPACLAPRSSAPRGTTPCLGTGPASRWQGCIGTESPEGDGSVRADDTTVPDSLTVMALPASLAQSSWFGGRRPPRRERGRLSGQRPKPDATLRGAGRDSHLVQTFTRESEHEELSVSEYANSVAAFDTWVRTGRKPTPHSVASSCGTFDTTYGGGCFYDPGYRPSSYYIRIRPRRGHVSWPAMTAAQERAWSRVDGVGIAP